MSIEQDVKRTQMQMLVRVKNILTQRQRETLDAMRGRLRGAPAASESPQGMNCGT